MITNTTTEQGANAFRVGVASIAILTIALGAFNIWNWLCEGLFILAVIAACSEAIGFIMATMVESAARQRRPLKASVALVILAACATFNVVGAERAWERSMETASETARMQAQTALDRERAELQAQLAQAQTIIRGYQVLMPTPETPRARQAGMMEAWRQATAASRETSQQIQRRLDAMPIVAEVAQPFPAWAVSIGFGFAEFVKALGLWACGVTAAAPPPRRRKTAETAREMETPVNVVPFPQETTRERVIRARFVQRWSFGQIERELGVRKGTAWKWCHDHETLVRKKALP